MGTAAGGFNQPDRLEEQAMVAGAVPLHQIAGRQRYQIQAGALQKGEY